MDDFPSKYANANQSDTFDINLSSGYLSGYFLYKSIEHFNAKETGSETLDQAVDEPFFGENIREAKAVLKDIFKK